MECFGKQFPMNAFDLKKMKSPQNDNGGAAEGTGRLGYQVGDTVSHVKFGTGRVISIEDGMRDYMVTVLFEEFGTKKMLAGFAKLKKQ